ncbi:beta-ribofuranosylaminobenzene 5'-phosphate synthase family protein [Haloarchaeobius iranensis]|uniref:Beta-ribofuranosylaminobenzene 5'-phosphate synthase n=1 Tax=Haloarchaeobius iranensis TaxID=996166 RepID=A0A1G9Z163_9EURY|nr:beta-ribofuranosylaminobenzene 5'-phosphate synthase family protein [Haloarchaeobius iranensis]SDN14443.1 beta-ribofuranosylaminobenzene 5'-phosphate synthase [Haloarchaeobius iranensis]
MATVGVGARLHFGFQNLSLAHARLYGGLGVALAEPRVRVTATRAESVDCADETVRRYAERATAVLEVPGATVSVAESLPRHVGLGSGTQLALATLAAVAHAYDREPEVRERAPELGRGGRSGVGVAAFEDGGFVVDGGHPTARFTTDPPATGEWTVPPVVARHELPTDWRFVLAVPDAARGRNGDHEEESMRAVVERADPGIADEVAGVVNRRLLPAAAEGRLDDFGDAVAAVGRLNGAWYADEQGGVFRPPVGTVVDELAGHPAVTGVGQSSWGPTVYGLTDAAREDAAAAAAREALRAADVDGEVRVVEAASRGARVE